MINLTFGYNFNKKIKKGVLPILLKILTFGNCYKKKIKENILPNSLQFIKLENNILKLNHLSNNIIKLQINNIYSKYLPNTIK